MHIMCSQVCSLEFDRKDISMNKLVATSLEGKFHVFDMRTQHPTKGFASVTEKVNTGLFLWRVVFVLDSTRMCLQASCLPRMCGILSDFVYITFPKVDSFIIPDCCYYLG